MYRQVWDWLDQLYNKRKNFVDVWLLLAALKPREARKKPTVTKTSS